MNESFLKFLDAITEPYLPLLSTAEESHQRMTPASETPVAGNFIQGEQP